MIDKCGEFAGALVVNCWRWVDSISLFLVVSNICNVFKCHGGVRKRTFSLFQKKMLQGSSIFSHDRPLVVRVSFTTCILGTLCLPLFGLITCVFISAVFHFEDSTGTHCQVTSVALCFYLLLQHNEYYISLSTPLILILILLIPFPGS